MVVDFESRVHPLLAKMTVSVFIYPEYAHLIAPRYKGYKNKKKATPTVSWTAAPRDVTSPRDPPQPSLDFSSLFAQASTFAYSSVAMQASPQSSPKF
jgi:hypothetical protein